MNVVRSLPTSPPTRSDGSTRSCPAPTLAVGGFSAMAFPTPRGPRPSRVPVDPPPEQPPVHTRRRGPVAAARGRVCRRGPVLREQTLADRHPPGVLPVPSPVLGGAVTAHTRLRAAFLRLARPVPTVRAARALLPELFIDLSAVFHDRDVRQGVSRHVRTRRRRQGIPERVPLGLPPAAAGGRTPRSPARAVRRGPDLEPRAGRPPASHVRR